MNNIAYSKGMDIGDVRGTKYARNMFGKFGLDLTFADVRVQHGVCFVRGQIKVLPKWKVPGVEREANKVAGIIKRSADVKEVVLECTFKEDHFAQGDGSATNPANRKKDI